ncbi:MAG: c-type cytochrome biogenesis protein CcmI [Chromatiales bacterium]|nr:c-type cytochrome biogenesis protein CcmI [Chromatiales bacterium]
MFWTVVAAMLALALALVMFPLLRHQISAPERARALNLRVYKARLAELEAERDNGVIAPDQFEATRADVQRELLGDVDPDAKPSPVAAAGRPAWGMAIVLVVAIPVAAILFYGLLGAQSLVPQFEVAIAQRGTAVAGGGDAAPQMSVEEMVERLEQKLQANPDNPEGWLMLGRSYTVMGRIEEAVPAYERALELYEHPPASVYLGLAQALATVNERNFTGRPAALLDAALAAEPDNPVAAWLRGFAHYQADENNAAIAVWRDLLARLDPDGEDATRVRESIQMAGGTVEGAPELAAAPEVVADAGARSVQVDVTLADELRSQLKGDETVFIFARAASGPPMPLAVARIPVSTLPTQVQLDDSMAMMPQLRISAFDQIRVQARVSRSGQPTASSGDFESESKTLGSDENQAALLIARVVP